MIKDVELAVEAAKEVGLDIKIAQFCTGKSDELIKERERYITDAGKFQVRE